MCGVLGVLLALPCLKLVGSEELQVVSVKPQPLRAVDVTRPQEQAAKKKKKPKKNRIHPKKVRVQLAEDSESGDSESEEVEVDEERVEEQVEKVSWASEHCECCTLICLGKACVGCFSLLLSVT